MDSPPIYVILDCSPPMSEKEALAQALVALNFNSRILRMSFPHDPDAIIQLEAHEAARATLHRMLERLNRRPDPARRSKKPSPQ